MRRVRGFRQAGDGGFTPAILDFPSPFLAALQVGFALSPIATDGVDDFDVTGL